MDSPTFGIPEEFVEQCINIFNDGRQLDQLQEECAELIVACSKVKRGNWHWTLIDPYESLREEMTHVLICLSVVARLHHIYEDDILAEVRKKAKKYNFVMEDKK
jgi:NTP pyrophosphatase (non-canonical NTP hydrolase)